MPTPELLGIGLVGFSTNCVLALLNILTREKEGEKLVPGWGWGHILTGAMMIIVGVSTYVTNALGNAAVSGYGGIALTYYGFYWIALGNSLVKGLDLRPIGQLSIAYAIVSIWFIAGAMSLNLWSLVLLLVVLVVVFLMLWPATHGNAAALRGAGVLLIVLAFLGFYIAFGFIFPKYAHPF
ncbi:MAG: hypothetical protein NZ988_04590 [Thaumarchaeota archaeon]|nr:hypothetical protein [Candidatus Calditenuaceae archaeon]MDW8187306.1 hypothetical protein [Nitrososphaerota archaeon]